MANGKPGRPRKQPEMPEVPEVPLKESAQAFDIEILKDGCHIGFLPDKGKKGQIVRNITEHMAKEVEEAGLARITARRAVPLDYEFDAYPRRRVGMRTGQ